MFLPYQKLVYSHDKNFEKDKFFLYVKSINVSKFSIRIDFLITY